MIRWRLSKPLLSKLHRWLGIFSAFFVIYLTVTGWLLNHSNGLLLDQSYISQEWILDWYGISPDQPPVSYPAGEHRVTWLDGRLYVDNNFVVQTNQVIVGAAATPRFLVAATQTQIYLILTDGRMVETLNGNTGIPAPLEAVGVSSDGQLALKGPQGAVGFDTDSLTKKVLLPSRLKTVKWARQKPLPYPLYETLLEDWRGQGLSMERLVQDLHSGRLFGLGGVLLMDFVGLLLCALAVTGLLIWMGCSGRRRSKKA